MLSRVAALLLLGIMPVPTRVAKNESSFQGSRYPEKPNVSAKPKIAMPLNQVIRTNVSALEIPRAELEAAASHLVYEIIVSGAQGKFSIVDNAGRSVMKDTDYPAPRQLYTRKWPHDPGEVPPEDDQTYTLAISFITVTKYTYVVKHCRRDGSVIKVIKDMDVESTDPSDKYFTAHRIFFT